MSQKLSFKTFINENNQDRFNIEKADDFPGGSAWIVSTTSDVSKIVHDGFHSDKSYNGLYKKVQNIGNEKSENGEIISSDDYIAIIYYSDEMSADESMHDAKKIVQYFRDHGVDES